MHAFDHMKSIRRVRHPVGFYYYHGTSRSEHATKIFFFLFSSRKRWHILFAWRIQRLPSQVWRLHFLHRAICPFSCFVLLVVILVKRTCHDIEGSSLLIFLSLVDHITDCWQRPVWWPAWLHSRSHCSIGWHLELSASNPTHGRVYRLRS
jgi:hypothetical protein